VTRMRLIKYFRHRREEVLAAVPDTARTILDVGCGAGVLGAALRRRQACEVWGIETDVEAAAEARAALDRVIEKPLPGALDDLPPAYFDTLVLADILEHLADPWTILRRLGDHLSPGATVLISLPNVQNQEVIRGLLRGRFTYVPSGILDATHLRFFTRASAVELVRRAGLTVEEVRPLYGARRDERAVRRSRPPRDLPVDPAIDLADYYASQYLLRARHPGPPPDTSRVRVSIVMLTFNRLDLTRDAVASLQRSTRQPHELILVDNGSSDGTPDYLAGLARDGVRVILNPANRGVPAGWNQGLQQANGDCLAVVNNDILVSGDWLERMTRAAHHVPRAGLVGCRAPAVGGPQMVEPDYDDLRDFPLFARRWSDLLDGSWFELPRIVAVAMLWRREVQDRVGPFDERFSPANFEDDDYSLRVLNAGYRNIVANDVFIHHVGSASHAANALDHDALVSAHRARLLEKWGGRVAPVMGARWAGYEEHVALLGPDQFVLPGWAVPALSRREVARHLSRVGRRLRRLGLATQARAAFAASLRSSWTLAGLGGLAWSAFPRRESGGPARAASTHGRPLQAPPAGPVGG
jgi:GT2 family glycosyltransferase/2-polyprenyl-3-methyl-5-hydroxy-6-metoxy-1,4-benzoquinol methylase